MTKEKSQSSGPRGHGGMFVGLDKPKNFKKTFRRLLTYLKPRRISLLLVFAAAILGTVFNVIGPMVMGNTITVIFEGAYQKFQGIPDAGVDFSKVGQLLLLLAGLYVFSSLFQFFQQYIMAGVSQWTVYDLREDVFEKINKLPLAYFDGRSHGDILSRVTNDLDTISTTLQQSLTSFITSFVTMIGIIIMMLWISPLLTVIAVLSIPLSVFVIRPLLKKDRKSTRLNSSHVA